MSLINQLFTQIEIFRHILTANTTREHLGYALALNVPTIAAITKIDICSSETIERNCRMLKNLFTSIGCGRIPFQIRTEDDVYVATDKISSQRFLKMVLKSRDSQ